MKTCILIVNLGTPDAPTPGAVGRYLREFLGDGRVIDFPWLPRKILVNGIIAPIRRFKSAREYKKGAGNEQGDKDGTVSVSLGVGQRAGRSRSRVNVSSGSACMHASLPQQSEVTITYSYIAQGLHTQQTTSYKLYL